mmetsp:Transcript_4195/g.11999  ORF Transcript_4195/g.11999 Transcript_4195/m.11999 type:complete len:260 (-) Transcript_4195:23-802(-)
MVPNLLAELIPRIVGAGITGFAIRTHGVPPIEEFGKYLLCRFGGLFRRIAQIDGRSVFHIRKVLERFDQRGFKGYAHLLLRIGNLVEHLRHHPHQARHLVSNRPPPFCLLVCPSLGDRFFVLVIVRRIDGALQPTCHRKTTRRFRHERAALAKRLGPRRNLLEALLHHLQMLHLMVDVGTVIRRVRAKAFLRLRFHWCAQRLQLDRIAAASAAGIGSRLLGFVPVVGTLVFGCHGGAEEWVSGTEEYWSEEEKHARAVL